MGNGTGWATFSVLQILDLRVRAERTVVAGCPRRVR